MEPQGPQVTKKNNECVPRVSKCSQMCTKGVKMEPQVLQWGPKVPQSAKKHKEVPEVLLGHEIVLQGGKKQTSTHRHKQPTNQRNKERHKETNNQTNTQTNKRTNTQTNTLTKTPLASHCKHKHKLPRPGARRRRRRSAAVRSAPLVGVLGPRVEKPRLKSFFLLRTDKVSSLGACTHQPFLKVTRTLVKPHF